MGGRLPLLVAALVVVAIGVPVLIAVAGGGDDGQDPAQDTVAAGPAAPRNADDAKDLDPVEPGRGGRQKPQVEAPSPRIAESGEVGAATVRRVVGERVGADQPSVISSECAGGTCTIHYRFGAKGRGAILGAQPRIILPLLRRDDVDRVELFVYAPGKPRHEDELVQVLQMRCSKSELGERPTVRRILRRCDVNVPEHDPREGKSNDGGPTAPPTAQSGAGRGAPERVPGTKAAQRRAREQRASRRRGG